MEAMAYNSLGVVYLDLGLYSDSYKELEHAYTIFKSINQIKGYHNALSNIGNLFYYAGDYKKALAYSFKALHQIKNRWLKNNYWKTYCGCAGVIEVICL